METPHERSALLLGATGLVGSQILGLLEREATYDRVVVVTRRPLPTLEGHQRIRQAIVDFENLSRHEGELAATHVFCAFGTTMKKAGTREQFRRVDLEYPKGLAEIARANGATHFLHVSSKGASSDSSNFYLRTKGELEDAFEKMSWPRLTILRPSIIGGNRAESRPLERLGQLLLSIAPPSIRTVPSSAIAKVMVESARQQEVDGTRCIESAEILSIARSLR